MRTGIANLPLHYGSAPRWLFDRMVKLAKGISEVIVLEHGHNVFLEKISDPHWFQAFGCVLGFDWHSSGVTTTVCGAVKEALKNNEFGLQVAGGKGKTSRKTPSEIENTRFSFSTNKINNLVYASRMAAKVDNNCVQDGYQLYHHCFIFTEKGKWAVVQQGMGNRYARRYHWLSDGVDDFVVEPQNAICCDRKHEKVLDMTAKQSIEARKISVDLAKENPARLVKILNMKARHNIVKEDLSSHTIRALKNAYEIQPNNYEELVSLRGIGPKSIRALALVSELVYGKPASYKDPVKFSFAHGGKDGFPYPVDKKVYDGTVVTLREALDKAKIGEKDKVYAIKRLKRFL